ncbi:MAG: type II toxin-antitoxin system HicA family toxin [Zetaproteobacteria bacterium]|nr:MAG: type II toxin-antitoxin system HicA family toxin [Zetaproteobacteria bacterium]
MTAKRRKTLQALFATPTRASIPFADIERLIVALGGEVRAGVGPRVVFELHGKRTYVHRPHPGREAKKYQVEEVREFLRSLEIAP